MTPSAQAPDTQLGGSDHSTPTDDRSVRPAPPTPGGRSRAAAASGPDASVVGWLVMAIAGLGGFAAITILLLNGWMPPFDQPLLDIAKQWQGLAPVWRVISESANIPLIVVGVGLVLVLFFTKRRREALLVALILIAITAGSEAVKQLVHRDRPSGTDPNIPGVVYSFPSGHVLEVLTIFGILAIHAFRSHLAQAVRVLIVVAVLVEADLVGVARVALAAHWPSDTIASFIGGLGVLGVYGLFTHHRAEPGDARGNAPPADARAAP
jgi:membrane-associated phospholipid phosphatase